MSRQSSVPHCRQIKGLLTAALSPFPPPGIEAANKATKKRACVKKGLGYERKVAREVQRWNESLEFPGEFHSGQWIVYTDENGAGYAQPDCFIVWEGLILLIECKLTQTDAAKFQLLGLYAPLLKHIFQRHVVCLQVCKNLREVPKKKVLHPRELLISPRPGMFTWHYLGN